MAKVIDAHHHWMPRLHCDEPERYLNPGETVRRDEKYTRVVREGIEIFTITALYHDIPAQLRAMDAAGVDTAVLSTGIWQEWNTMETAPFINNQLAELQKTYLGRIIGLAHVPPFDPRAPRELERAARELGLRGIALVTHCQGLYLDAKEYAPLYRKAEELGLPILVHAAGLPLEYGLLNDYGLIRSVGRAYEQTVCAAKLVASGVLAEFPRLRIVIGHLGGAFFVLKHRIVASAPGLWTVPAAVSQSVSQVLFDTAPAQWSRYEVECAVGTLGAKQMVFGTDYPVVDTFLETGMAFMREAQVPPEEKERILGGNVAELLRLD